MEKVKLGDIIEVTRGTSLAGDDYSDSGTLVRLTLGNFDYVNNVFKVNTSKEDIYYTGEVKENFILKEGDIITPLTEQTVGLLGSTARIPESGKYIQSQDVGLVKCISDKIDDSFIYYLLSSHSVKKQLGAGAQQTSIRHTSPDKIKACQAWIPTIEQQRKIGDFMATLDAKIALNRRMNEELEGMAKMLYDYWFVQFDFPNEEGKPYKSSGGAMEYNAVLKREIPAGWKVKEINNLVDFEADTLSPSGEPTTTYKHVSIPSYDSCGDYQEEMGQAILSDKFVVTDSHVLVSKLNPWVNRVVWGRDIKNLIASTEFVMWQVKDLQYKSFLYYTAQTGPFIGYCTKASTGTSHSHRRVDPNIMLRYLVPFNETIVKKYSDMSRPFVEHRYKNLKEISNLTALRDKLLPLLMNGQVRVAD